jgi:Flp pilus assembly protein TadG
MMRRGRKGQSVLEFSLFLPFLLFMFIGAFDWGFYAWALITTENAARAAALYTSSSAATAGDSAGACVIAAAELTDAPNVYNQPTTCSAAPLVVTATLLAGPDGSPASQVAVTYTTLVMIPIPGLLTGQTTIRRAVQMRVQS